MRDWDRLKVRGARPADLVEIVAIYNSTVASRQVTADTEPVTVASREAWFAAHQCAERPLWVVEDGAGLLGWLSFSSFYGRPAYAGTAEVSIYLHERARGKGLGRWLLDEALRAAPALGLHTLLGFIFGHNRPSIALFEQAGFTTWGMLPRVAVLDGLERDLLILGCRIAEDASVGSGAVGGN
ncbi:GNAT family N-acetyltransferase [Chitinilyticum piscinae]|uniref:N-acetyltransferase n=1 Tax=Chitinilyticum piscinae TaxID=2866724 RepID=A0A8J7FLG1_9NEIS|nr:GNAT family N-acetyltransferase [Chitinilyticum piscinae]MBE9609975.1 N-acetyltransferase [Chitinilyticum piscinae]